jgi:hypothetical protein
MQITEQQKRAIKEVVQYSIEDERRDCEETLYTTFDDIDFESMSDKELDTFCEENGIVHIWNYLYELSLIG